MRRLVALFVLATPAAASAHVALVEPPARYERDYLKAGPCGHPDNPPGEVMATYAPGETITVRWDEFIGHPGHFRLALSAEGDGAFVDPMDYDDFYSAANVLLDDIEDPPDRRDHQVELTLPAGLECEACVLQLIQVMTDKPPWGPEGGNELYYQCADIRIVVGAGGDEPSDGGAASEGAAEDGDAGCGCTQSGRSNAGWWGLASILLALRRRGRAGCRRTPRADAIRRA